MIYLCINGRLGADAELKTSKNNGNQFVTMRVASNDFANGERTTTWVNVVWTGERAIKMSEYMKKGSSVIIHGTGRFSTYTDKNNANVVSIDVFADRIDFDSNSSNSGNTQTTDAVVDPNAVDVSKQEAQDVAAVTAPDDDLPF